MYEEFFGLTQRPFAAVPHAEENAAAPAYQEALDALIHCVSQSRGIAVVTSPPGLGKTSLCKQLAALLRQQVCAIHLSSAAFPTRRALLQAILFELDVHYVGLSEQEARLQVLDAARRQRAEGRAVLLILDEAHLLQPRLFEELRTLADYAPDAVPLIRLVLCGQFELEEKLADPAMSAFNQRIGTQVCLEPLTLDESARFLIARLRQCGAEEPLSLITDEALEAICRASDGNLRCLTQLADHAFLLAFAEETRPVTPALVRAALDDLKELPLHWNDLPPPAGWDDAAADTDWAGGPQWDAALDDEPLVPPDINAPAGTADNVFLPPLTPEMDAAERETDEFEIPEYLLGLASVDPDEATPMIPLADNHEERSPCDGGTAPPCASGPVAEREASPAESNFVPYAVIEVGSGLDAPLAALDSASALPSPDPLSAISHGAASGEAVEVAIIDRYARLDRIRELPEERRDEIQLPDAACLTDSERYPYLAFSGLAAEGWDPIEGGPPLSEEEILETVQQIRREIVAAVDRERELIERGRVCDFEVPLSPFDIVQPDSPAALPGAAPLSLSGESGSFRTAGAEESAGERRFAQLFTRLRDRRRKIEAQRVRD